MAVVLIIAGLALMAVGAIVFLLPTPKKGGDEAQALDIGEVLEQINALLEKLDKRYRPGLVLMLLGLALVGLGVYVRTTDAKDAAEKAAGTPASVIVMRPGIQ